MDILVCISNVPDTTTKIRFNNNKTLLTDDVQWIINPWDELALTRALEIKEASNGAIQNIIVAHVGLSGSEQVIRKALAIGADSAIRINTEPKDAYYVAVQLSEVIRKKKFDIILCGIESSDYNNSTVGGMLAELLGYNSVSGVSFLHIENENIQIKREVDGGYEKISTALPFVAVVQKGIAIEPRIPAMRGIMSARTKAIEVIEPVEVSPLTEYVEFELPEAKAKCKMINSSDAKELIRILRSEVKII